MKGSCCRELAAIAALLLAVLFTTSAAIANEFKLLTTCGEPVRAGQADTQPKSGDKANVPPQPSLSPPAVACNLRVTDFVVFRTVKVTVAGKTETIDSKYEAFDPRTEQISALFMMQVLPRSQSDTQTLMGENIATSTMARDGKRRFAAYSFANDLNMLSDFGASPAEFDREVKAVRPATYKIQLYSSALRAIEKLAKEDSARKALVIFGDGTSDDVGYTHEQVVKAAKDAGVVIYAVGYNDNKNDRPKFQHLRRLAEETGGIAREVRQAGKDFSEDVISPRFVGELLENGGKLSISLAEVTGATTLNISADFTDGRILTAEHKVTAPPPPPPPVVPPASKDVDKVKKPPPSTSWYDDALSWAEDNPAALVGLGSAIGLGIIAFVMFGFGQKQPPLAPAILAQPAATPTTDAQGQPVIFGWLEMLDGNASRYPLKTTNVRIGRHRDNDICLHNDSISRRHAVLHFNSETRRFVITDLGGGNGILVNKNRYKSRELSDGDMVELGEVRLRFRTEI